MAPGDPDEFEAGPVPAGMFSESMEIDDGQSFLDMVSQDFTGQDFDADVSLCESN